MSLFKVREWWTTRCGDEEDYDQGSVCITNIDNNPDGTEKIIIGSHSGILRIFSVNSRGNDVQTLNTHKPSDLLLEVDLKIPILGLVAGLLLSATDKIHLAILHPRKLSVFSVAATAGVAEHGLSYNILLIYEHNLKRSSYNLVAGSFGQVKGREFLCIQSLDGVLSFYEQETFAFSRFLPNFLVPGPLAYIPSNDSFIVATSSWTVESYRYQVLVISKSQEDETTNKGRKVTPDWTFVVGECVIDIQIVHLQGRDESSMVKIVVLGERNLFVLKENGTVSFIKRFDFNPSCLSCYANDSNDSLIILIATELHTLLVYANDVLKWAAQLPFKPIFIERKTISNIRGTLVCLVDDGTLSCLYLGTSPSLNIVHVKKSEAVINDYSEAEQELQELRKIISAFNSDSNVMPGNISYKSNKHQSDITIAIKELKVIDNNPVATVHRTDSKSSAPLVYQILLDAVNPVSNIRLIVDVSQPLKAEPSIANFESIPIKSNSAATQVSIELSELLLPSSIKLTVIVSYMNNQSAPRVCKKSIHLPLNLIAKSIPPFKDTDDTINLDIVCHTSLLLKEIFTEFTDIFDPSNGSDNSSIGIEFFDQKVNPVKITIISKNQQQKFRVKSDSFGGLTFIAYELIRRLQAFNVKFDLAVLDRNSIPLDAYLSLIKEHLELRVKIIDEQTLLSKCATEFRAIEKRFLVKFKDRNPTPLNNLDLLLHEVYIKILDTNNKVGKAIEDYTRSTNILSCATNLIISLVSMATNLKQEQLATFKAVFTNHVSEDIDEGWEERLEVALLYFLSQHMKDDSFAMAKYVNYEFSIPEDTGTIKRLINNLLNLFYKGDIFKPASGFHREIPVNHQNKFLSPSNEIIPEEDEENELNDRHLMAKSVDPDDAYNLPENTISPL